MIGLDTTVLLAHEMKEVAGHAEVRRQIGDYARKGESRFALAPQVVSEFLHVATDPLRFEKPLKMVDALQRAAFWWNAAEVERCVPDERATGLLLTWLGEHRLGRKRILDTALAANYHIRGVKQLATANPDDFRVFGVFTFEDWAIPY